MQAVLSRAKSILVELPKHGKLAYCLLRDDRVPAPAKVLLLGTIGVIVSPLDFPAWVPLFGELDILALSVLAVKVFIDSCPEAIRAEHEAALEAGDSIFHRDFRGTMEAAREGAGLLVGRFRSRHGRGSSYPSVPEE